MFSSILLLNTVCPFSILLVNWGRSNSYVSVGLHVNYLDGKVISVSLFCVFPSSTYIKKVAILSFEINIKESKSAIQMRGLRKYLKSWRLFFQKISTCIFQRKSGVGTRQISRYNTTRLDVNVHKWTVLNGSKENGSRWKVIILFPSKNK
jgi:hypothetical protein